MKSFIVSSVSQMPNLRHECEPLGEGGEVKAYSKQWVLRRWRNVCDDEQARMPDDSEFQTEGAAMLKPLTTDWCSIENVRKCGNWCWRK